MIAMPEKFSAVTDPKMVNKSPFWRPYKPYAAKVKNRAFKSIQTNSIYGM